MAAFSVLVSRMVLNLLIHGTILCFNVAKKKTVACWSQLVWAGES